MIRHLGLLVWRKSSIVRCLIGLDDLSKVFYPNISVGRCVVEVVLCMSPCPVCHGSLLTPSLEAAWLKLVCIIDGTENRYTSKLQTVAPNAITVARHFPVPQIAYLVEAPNLGSTRGMPVALPLWVWFYHSQGTHTGSMGRIRCLGDFVKMCLYF